MDYVLSRHTQRAPHHRLAVQYKRHTLDQGRKQTNQPPIHTHQPQWLPPHHHFYCHFYSFPYRYILYNMINHMLAVTAAGSYTPASQQE